jgi:hypothetical protein
MDIRQPLPFGLFAPRASLVPIETNVETTPPPTQGTSINPEQPVGTTSGAVGSHGMDGRYNMILPTKEEIALRHGCWHRRRQQIRAIFETGIAGRSRRARWDSCGSQAMLHWHKSGQWVLCQAFLCHDRFCYPCSRARSSKVAQNLSRKLQQSGSRFATLTLRSDNTPLSKQIDRLYKSFRTLRADEWWDKNVTGGCAFLEVTWTKATKQWHPHLHPIVCGTYIPQNVLSRKWLAITGNSPIVHIQYIPNSEVVARYVSKYAAKCLDDSIFDDPGALSEAIVSQSGRRHCLTFGDWRGWKLLDHAPLDMSDFKPVGSLTHVTREAAIGEQWAVHTLHALRRNLRWDALNPDALDDNILFGT